MTDDLKIFRKAKGKSAPISIDKNTQRSIKSFKMRLLEMCDNQEVNQTTQTLIHYILNELEEYDLNLLIAYYDQAECSSSKLSKLVGGDPSNITTKINKIIKKCRSSI